MNPVEIEFLLPLCYVFSASLKLQGKDPDFKHSDQFYYFLIWFKWNHWANAVLHILLPCCSFFFSPLWPTLILQHKWWRKGWRTPCPFLKTCIICLILLQIKMKSYLFLQCSGCHIHLTYEGEIRGQHKNVSSSNPYLKLTI